MNLGESLLSSFEPDIYIRVAKMVDGEPVLGLLMQVYEPLRKEYHTLLDTKKGIIYLKRKGEKRCMKS